MGAISIYKTLENMQDFQFNYRGTVITVHIEKAGNGMYFAFIDPTNVNLIKEFILKGGGDNSQVGYIQVSAYSRIVDANRQPLGNLQRRDYKDHKFDLWFDLPVADVQEGETLGTYINKQRLNGLLARNLGKEFDQVEEIRCVAPDGAFYQPLVIDLVPGEATITINIIDGVASADPYSFDDGETWIAGVEFGGFDPGTHKVLYKNSIGIIAAKEVTLAESE